MKRDMDLYRFILLEIERLDDTDGLDPITIDPPEGHSQLSVSRHVELMENAGLLESIDFSSKDGHDCRPRCLTNAGHDLVADIRDPVVWKKTKAGAKQIGSITIDVLKDVAKSIITARLRNWTDGEYDLSA